MRKNETFRTTITDMTVDGAGVGRAQGMPFFVKDAVIGDEVVAAATKVKKTYGYARLVEVTRPSPCRVEPLCPVSGQCGGCTLMAMGYESTLKFKEDTVKNALIRIGGLKEEEVCAAAGPIIGMAEPTRFRNKCVFPVGNGPEGRPLMGFYAPRSHRIVETEDCVVGIRENSTILRIIADYMQREQVPAYDETMGEGLIRHIMIRKAFATGELMVCIIAAGGRLPLEEALAERLRDDAGVDTVCINKNNNRGNAIFGAHTRTILGRGLITDRLCGLTFEISPRSFYQVNPVQTEKLYQTALDYGDPGEGDVVWDLYSGIGTISLLFARRAAQVIGVESVEAAVLDAGQNARSNGIENAKFICGLAEDVLADESLPAPDIIVVDPPRKGLAPRAIDAMTAAAPRKIVYVSCNPSTLARDLRLLKEKGYHLQKYVPVDQFGWTGHVETVVLMSRVEGK